MAVSCLPLHHDVGTVSVREFLYHLDRIVSCRVNHHVSSQLLGQLKLASANVDNHYAIGSSGPGTLGDHLPGETSAEHGHRVTQLYSCF